jgi:hypothetical protein
VVKQMLESVDRLGTDEAKRIRALTPPVVIRQIESSTRVDWVPYSTHLKLDEAVLEVLGHDRYLNFRRRHTNQLSESATMRQVLSGVLSLFGVSPRRLYQMSPRAYQYLVRDGGSFTVEDDGPGRVKIIYADVPAELVSSPVWRLGLVGTFQAMLDLARRKGEVEVSAHDVERGTVVVVATWQGND